jgi:hypothetical protein
MNNTNYKKFGLLLATAVATFGVISLLLILFNIDSLFSPLILLLILVVPSILTIILASIIIKKKENKYGK